MLFQSPPNYAPLERGRGNDGDIRAITLADMLSIVWRGSRIIIFCTILASVLGAAYILTSTPNYVSSAKIFIDPRQSDPLPAEAQNAQTTLINADNLLVDSEMEIARSFAMVKRVATTVRAESDPELTSASRLDAMLNSLRTLVSTAAGTDTGGVNEDFIHRAFARKVFVQRIGTTYVIEIGYASRYPQRAAEVANALAQEYLNQQIESQFESVRRSKEWIRLRLDQLRGKVQEADQAVEDYKSANSIVDVGGTLVSDRQLQELNSQLVTAQAEVSRAKVKYESVRDMIQQGDSATASFEEAGNSAVLSKLRTDYALASKRTAELRTRYGATHGTTINALADMKQLQQLINEEIKRYEQNYLNAYQAALARETALTTSMKTLRIQSLSNSQQQIRLRELQRQANSEKVVYENLLDSFNRASQRETLPTTKARIIEPATVPLSKNWPKSPLIMSLMLFMGLGTGFGLVLIREGLNRYIWTEEELESITQRSFIGYMPKVNLRSFEMARPRLRPRSKSLEPVAAENSIIPSHALAPWRSELSNNFGPLAELLRAVHVHIRLASQNSRAGEGQVIAIASTLPGEGKSTLSLLLALHVAQTRSRTLLIDCDLRKRDLTSRLSPAEQRLLRSREFGHVLRDPIDGLDFIAADGMLNGRSTIDAMVDGLLTQEIEKLKPRYDYIFIDLPPLLLMPECRVLAPAINQVIYVVEWGKTDRASMGRALAASPEIAQCISGSIFNKVDPKKISSYLGYKYTGYGYNQSGS